MTHWHAYAFTGRSYPDSLIRRGEVPANYPPIEIKDWLARPSSQIAETFTDLDAAADWIKRELVAMPPIDAASFPVADRVAYSRRTLRQADGADVVHGYYAQGGSYVSRALISCPREPGGPGPGCPARPAQPRAFTGTLSGVGDRELPS